MAILTVPNPTFHFRTSTIFGNHLKLPNSNSLPIKTQSFRGMSLVAASSRKNTRTESAKTLNRRRQNKFNGTPSKPRLSVFCSGKQLYAMLVDDRNKKSLFYGNTLQKSIRGDPPCSTIEAAERLGEEVIKACVELEIEEVSYDRNGNAARREKMQAFEIAISRHGFLPDRATRARRVPAASP